MIRADSLKKLSEEIVLKNLLDKLEPIGFKYLKSKHHFKRTKGNFDQIISFGTSHSPLEFNDDTDELNLKFYINSRIESPKFDKWVMRKLKSRSFFRHSLGNVKCIELVDFDYLNKNDFFTPTESQQFKNYVTSSLVGIDRSKRINLLDFGNKLPQIIKTFDDLNTAKDLYKNKTQSFRDYLRLLVFENEIKQAEIEYLEKYNQIKNKIDLTNLEDAKNILQSLEKFAIEIAIFFQIKLDNPIKRELTKSVSKEEKIKLAKKLGYQEIFRFDFSLLNIESFDINDLGEVLIATKGKEVIKINSNGNINNIGKLNFDDCFSNDFYSLKIKWIENANTFSCNNYILSENDELIELVFDFDKSKFKINEVQLSIKELSFDSDKQEYHFLYLLNYKKTYHSIYDKNGHLISTKTFDKNILKLNLKRQEYIALSLKNSVDIINFKGDIQVNYKYGNGNEGIALQPNGKSMILYGYSTKSQHYDLDSRKKKTLWAHPTFLKNYKENFYNDINQNFGLNIARFTPDGKHIIGGADHGKYVVWDAEKLERKEMIPNQSSLKIFNWFTTSYENGKSNDNYFKPYTVEHENQKLFINRGYDITDIYFIDNGKYIITQVSDCLLVWDECFKNIGYIYGIGKVIFSSKNYLAYKSKNELVIHKKVNGFNNTFESSVFKEYTKEDSNIINHKVEKEELEVKQIENKISESIKKSESKDKTAKKKGFFRKLFKK